jgi:hypothetical protein
MTQSDAIIGLIAELYATSALKDTRIRELEAQLDIPTAPQTE